MKKAAPILLALMIAACGSGQDESGMMEDESGMMADSAQAGEMMGDESEMGGMMEDSSATGEMGEMMEPDSTMARDTSGMGNL